MNKTRILVVDDHRLFLEGVRKHLEPSPGFEVVGSASDGQRALQILKNLEVDVIVLDINMPNLDGAETARKVREQYPTIRILIVSMHKDYKYISNLKGIGVHGYILKNSGPAELVSAIQKLAQGEEYFSQEVKNVFFENHGKKEVIPHLTTREIEVLRLIAKGKTSPEISDQLHIAKSTADQHRKNLLSKTDCRNVLELVRWALENGFG